MTKKTRTKTTITKQIIKQVEELSKQGFNNIMISQSLNIATTTLSTNKKLKEAIQRGRLELAKSVSKTVIATLRDNPTNQQLLIKCLGLFNPILNIKKPNNAQEALDNLSIAIEQYAKGLINESQLRTLEAVTNSYVKNKHLIELEERVKALEDKNNMDIIIEPSEKPNKSSIFQII